jgi:hypothetical protein
MKIEAVTSSRDHGLGGSDLGLAHGTGGLDLNNDGMIEVDQVVGCVGEERRPPFAAVRRAAGSTGAKNFGVTEVAAPKAASSSTARYSRTARRGRTGSSRALHPTLAVSVGFDQAGKRSISHSNQRASSMLLHLLAVASPPDTQVAVKHHGPKPLRPSVTCLFEQRLALAHCDCQSRKSQKPRRTA